MVTTFHDASALVKRYLREPGSDIVRSITERIVVSDLSLVEVPSAIWRKQRSGSVTSEDAGLLVSAFGYDARGDADAPPRFSGVSLAGEVLERAADLLPRYELRTGDAVQLASALAARASLEGCDVFVAFDRRLRAAAVAEGFTLLPERISA